MSKTRSDKIKVTFTLNPRHKPYSSKELARFIKRGVVVGGATWGACLAKATEWRPSQGVPPESMYFVYRKRLFIKYPSPPNVPATCGPLSTKVAWDGSAPATTNYIPFLDPMYMFMSDKAEDYDYDD